MRGHGVRRQPVIQAHTHSFVAEGRMLLLYKATFKLEGISSFAQCLCVYSVHVCVMLYTWFFQER